MKIAMLGVSGSGKTAFLAGVKESLWQVDAHGFNITPRARHFYDRFPEIGRWDDLNFVRENEYRFPDGTTQETQWSFDLNYAQQPVIRIDSLDYRGGIFNPIGTEAFEDNRDQISRVAHFLGECQGIIIFFESIRLPETNPPPSFTEGINTISQILNAYLHYYPDQPLCILIALTKADLVRPIHGDFWVRNNFEYLLNAANEKLSGIIRLIRGCPTWTGGMAVISAVGDVSEIQIEGDEVPPPPIEIAPARPPTDRRLAERTNRIENIAVSIRNRPIPTNIKPALFWLICCMICKKSKTRLSSRNNGPNHPGEARVKDIQNKIKHNLDEIQDIRNNISAIKEERDYLEKLQQNLDGIFGIRDSISNLPGRHNNGNKFGTPRQLIQTIKSILLKFRDRFRNNIAHWIHATPNEDHYNNSARAERILDLLTQENTYSESSRSLQKIHQQLKNELLIAQRNLVTLLPVSEDTPDITSVLEQVIEQSPENYPEIEIIR